MTVTVIHDHSSQTERLDEVGLFAVDHVARTIRGVLVPWGVKSKTNRSRNKPISFPRGSITVPRDVSVVGINLDHDRHRPLGRAVALEDTRAGLVATFALADTDDVDAWLEDRGEFVKLSAEVRDMRRGADDSGTATLTGAALVSEGAFEGAALFSVDVDEDEPDEDDGDQPDEDDVDEVDVEDDEEDSSEEEEGSDMGAASAPETMLAGRSRKPESPRLTKAGFFAAVNHARRSGDRAALAPYIAEAEEIGLFALSNITYDDAGGLVTLAGHPGEWLGQLWQGKGFPRKIVPLLTPRPLTALTMTGWVWGQRPVMGPWSGNKTPIPTNAPTVAPRSFTAVRFAGGHDLAREYYDFNVTDVIDSYGEAMVDSYAQLSDAYALTQITAGATPYIPDPANTVNKGLLDIIDGALAVIAAGGTPTWALVAPDIYKSILATPHEDALDYLSAAIGLESGTVSSGFPIIPDARLAAGTIIVGDRAGATVWELPGVPIRVSAPDLVLGGVDNSFHGYIGVGVTTPAVVVKNTGVVGTSEGVLVDGVEESVLIAAEKSRK